MQGQAVARARDKGRPDLEVADLKKPRQVDKCF